MIFVSHENNIADPMVEFILWRLLTRNTFPRHVKTIPKAAERQKKQRISSFVDKG